MSEAPFTFYRETNLKEVELNGRKVEIPKEWEVVKVDNIITEAKPGFASGKRDENGIIQLRMNNITTDGRVVLDQYLKVPIPKNKNINDYLLKPGDVLFNNTNSVDLLGKSAVFRGECEFCTYSNHITRLRVKEGVTIPEWLVYNFIRLWQMQYFKQIAIRHVGQAGIRKTDLLNIKLPLPPLEEQKKIAEVLRTIDEAIQAVDESIAKMERLKRETMERLLTRGINHTRFKTVELNGRKVEIPEEWEVVELGEIGKLQYGYTASAMEEDTGVKFLRITDIAESGRILWERVPYCEISPEDYKKYKLQRGDIVFARIGATAGKAGFVDKDVDGVFASYLIRLRITRDTADPLFVFYFTQSPLYWDTALRIRDAQLKKGINSTMLSGIQIPLPPLPEQKQIAEILRTIDEAIEAKRAKREKLERMKKAVMEKLLTGEIRVR
ncbi:restriction endonuclease subunit S [Thermococcus aciditolerans]|uniref:Type I restriction modification DNA specificity domain-containing protein n=1 Tax=Thermococcus aciditolerans TaxID=2598455 RepID=A0A5C0SM97_9EURY|nr:restriction endonuclease subunit S [Thermococcus aciditolerans]QEK15450.1 hypothetical protein FPV09_10535 [Thermococcus aciditolerans]